MRVLSVDEFHGPEFIFGVADHVEDRHPGCTATAEYHHIALPLAVPLSGWRISASQYGSVSLLGTFWRYTGDRFQSDGTPPSPVRCHWARSVQPPKNAMKTMPQDSSEKTMAKLPVNAVYKNTIKMRYRTNSVLHRSLGPKTRRTSAARDVEPNRSHAKASQCYPVCADMPGASLPMPPPGRRSM